MVSLECINFIFSHVLPFPLVAPLNRGDTGVSKLGALLFIPVGEHACLKNGMSQCCSALESLWADKTRIQRTQVDVDIL